MPAATVGVTTAFTVGTAPVAICATNTGRRGVIIENTHATATALVGFGTNNATNSTVANWLQVAAYSTNAAASPYNGLLTLGPIQPLDSGKNSIPPVVPSGDISVCATITNLTLVVTEW